MEKSKLPLVSFCIVTWNTSKYIVETLECAKNQTYQNIELIVSDDCSTDNTIAIVEDWIKKNGNRFVRTEIITVSQNTGEAANKNRAERACKGDYIKSLDGDDLVDPSFIEKCVNILQNNPEYSFVFTKTYSLLESEHKSYMDDESHYKSGDIFKEIFMVDFWLRTTAWFFKNEISVKTHYNEDMFLSVDYLRSLQIAKLYKIYYLDEYLTYYRRHDDNMKKENNKWIKKGMFKYFESQMIAISFFKDYYLYENRKERILKYLIAEAVSYRPSYLIKMSIKYRRFEYLKIYYNSIVKEIRALIKNTMLFKILRQTKLWKKIKGEI